MYPRDHSWYKTDVRSGGASLKHTVVGVNAMTPPHLPEPAGFKVPSPPFRSSVSFRLASEVKRRKTA